MEKEQLLGTLDKLISRYEQHRSFIDKASSQTGKFSAAVIEKVVLDHEIKSAMVADEISPLIPALQQLIVAAEKERLAINASKGSIDDEVQELELRAAIGELEETEFDGLVAQLRDSQATAAERLSGVEADINHLRGIEDRWVKVGRTSAVAAPAPVVPEAPTVAIQAPAPVATPPVATSPIFGQPQAVSAQPVMAQPQVDDDGHYEDQIGAHSHRTKIREDIGSVFPTDGSASSPARVQTVDDDIAIATNEAEEGGNGPEVQVGFDEEDEDEDGGVDIFGGSDGDDFGNGVVSVSGAQQGEMPVATAESPRRALLLYQEGTPEEQIYPFTGDTLTVGRGRENDIQIKNDSKVSRYHCRLTRQGNNFYIEDVKSSNGTLVNGELITDRRLFGGEEVIIGETFFRFRIME